MTEGNKGKVIYFGTMVWTHSPNAGIKKTRIKITAASPGSVILKNFIYDDGEWSSRTVCDPESGKTYSGKISLNGQNQLKLSGNAGIPAFGLTAILDRSQKKLLQGNNASAGATLSGLPTSIQRSLPCSKPLMMWVLAKYRYKSISENFPEKGVRSKTA